MTCGTCAVHVKKALENIPGVQSAHVPYTKGGAQFVLNAGASPTPLIAAVAGLGYCSTLVDASSAPARAGLLDQVRESVGGGDKAGYDGSLHIAVIDSAAESRRARLAGRCAW